MKRSCSVLCLLAMFTITFLPHFVVAQEDTAKVAKKTSEELRLRTIERGLQYLRQSQSEDGTLTIKAGPGITALAITAAIRSGEPLDSPMVSKGMAALESFVKPDGGIYGSGRLRNYETCIGILCFAEANRGGKYNTILQNAKRFVKTMQYGVGSDSTGDKDDVWNGGAGYGAQGRPDLSNTAYLIEALRTWTWGPTIRRSRRHLPLFPVARICQANITRRPLPPKQATADSITKSRRKTSTRQKTKRRTLLTGACAAMAR